MSDTVTQNPSIILDKETIDVPLMIGDMPGTPQDQADPDDMFSGSVEKPAVDPKQAMIAARSNGAVLSVSHAVAEGTTGSGFDILPRFKDRFEKGRENWPEGAADQYDALQVFLQTGFTGKSIRDGLYTAEHDRFILGWGGVTVARSKVPENGIPPKPLRMGRFQACGARFTKPDAREVMVPTPVALDDGRIVWVEIPRRFRRIRFQSSAGRVVWFKEYGDWRSMDARTGKYSTGVRWSQGAPGQLGSYTAGRLPKNAQPATEVMHWNTSFPGVGPYGVSGWHSEMSSVSAAREHVDLLITYLKSGLHSVVLAAANRPFEDATLDAAISRIDELGRGRKGLGAIISISLKPTDSRSPVAAMGEQSDDRGRIILHQLTTQIPKELLDDTLSDTLSVRIANSERIPGLLLGRSDSYNFATAAAAWTAANRLRFLPHHLVKEESINRMLIEMGVTHWMVKTRSPEWEEREKLSSIAGVVGNYGGLSVNRAIQVMSTAMGKDLTTVEAWWGDLPMALVIAALNSKDPQGFVDSLDLPGNPRISMDPGKLVSDVGNVANRLNSEIGQDGTPRNLGN